jgi:hypothetical protein
MKVISQPGIQADQEEAATRKEDQEEVKYLSLQLPFTTYFFL